jgi:preprotein translocase subunit SecY
MQKKNILIKKIIFTIFIVLILRIGAHIPVANVDQKYLLNIITSNPSLKTFFNTKNLILSIFSLGIIPSINSSIFIQILTSLFPYFQKLQKKEGRSGRKQIKQYTRFLTLILALFQSFSITLTLKPFLFNSNFNTCFEIILTLTTGAMVVLWLSDLITEFGIGNGSSIILALNIISILPNTLNLIIESETLFSIITIIIRFIILIIGIIYLQEGVKIIPLITSKQLFINKNKNTFTKTNAESFLPLKINQVGIMPLIFSSTFLSFCINFGNFIINKIPLIESFFLTKYLNGVFIFFNFITIVIFCFFYSNLVLNPKELAKELNQMEVIVENIRPGKQTFSFLKKTLNRLTLIGSLFLGILGTFSNIGNTFGFGISSLIILVGVIIDITRQITKKSL